MTDVLDQDSVRIDGTEYAIRLTNVKWRSPPRGDAIAEFETRRAGETAFSDEVVIQAVRDGEPTNIAVVEDKKDIEEWEIGPRRSFWSEESFLFGPIDEGEELTLKMVVPYDGHDYEAVVSTQMPNMPHSHMVEWQEATSSTIRRINDSPEDYPSRVVDMHLEDEADDDDPEQGAISTTILVVLAVVVVIGAVVLL